MADAISIPTRNNYHSWHSNGLTVDLYADPNRFASDISRPLLDFRIPLSTKEVHLKRCMQPHLLRWRVKAIQRQPFDCKRFINKVMI